MSVLSVSRPGFFNIAASASPSHCGFGGGRVGAALAPLVGAVVGALVGASEAAAVAVAGASVGVTAAAVGEARASVGWVAVVDVAPGAGALGEPPDPAGVHAASTNRVAAASP